MYYLIIAIYLQFWPVLYLTAHWAPTVDHMNMNKWMNEWIPHRLHITYALHYNLPHPHIKRHSSQTKQF